MRRFYTPQPLVLGQLLSLEPQLVHYLAQVLRLAAGAKICLFNGDTEVSASLQSLNKKHGQALIEEILPSLPASPLITHLGQALGKGDKMEWVVQKACELGVNFITPLFSHKSDVRLNPERAAKKQQQWQQIAISACEQSGRCDVPQIALPCKLEDWLSHRTEDLRLVLHPAASQVQLSQLTPPASLALLIGPEGGLSAQEVSLAQAHAFQNLSLGPRILRTETAPISALSLVQYLWGDLENSYVS